MNTKCCVTERVTGSGVMCDLCVIVTHHDRPQEIAWLSQLDLVIDESCWLHHVSCLRSVAGKTLFYLWSGPGGAHHPHRVIMSSMENKLCRLTLARLATLRMGGKNSPVSFDVIHRSHGR